MNTIKINKGNVRIIAHRGLSGIECENTNAAFVAAGNKSYFGIEADVHLTADGKFAIIHDDSTGRVCDTDITVENSTLHELQKLVLKNPGFDEFRSDYCIPELKEYIGICRKYEKICVLELKNRIRKSKIEKIVEIVKGETYLDGMVFISFNWDNIVDIKAVIPQCKAQFLTGECDDKLISKLKKHNFGLDIYKNAVTPELVSKLHSNGIEINCWTVDNPKEAERLVSYGVDYITSNIIE